MFTIIIRKADNQANQAGSCNQGKRIIIKNNKEAGNAVNAGNASTPSEQVTNFDMADPKSEYNNSNNNYYEDNYYENKKENYNGGYYDNGYNNKNNNYNKGKNKHYNNNNNYDSYDKNGYYK